MKTPILETERLILRPLQVTDAQEIFDNWASDPEVTKFMTYSTHKDVEVTKTGLVELKETVDSDSYDWGFVRKADTSLSTHAKENPNSGKVMEKVGFCYTCDGQYDKIDGSRHFESKCYVLEV